MKRLLCAVLGIASIAAAADAATLSVVSNKSLYYYGETITLTVTGDDQGASANAVFGRLLYNGAILDNGTRQQTQLVGQYGKWTTGALNQGDTNVNSPTSAFSYAFNQITLTQQTATNLPWVISTVTLIAANLGVVNVSWDTTGPTALDFFGLTNAPGTTFEIYSCCIPEPSTGALFGLGLLALGTVGRNGGGS